MHTNYTYTYAYIVADVLKNEKEKKAGCDDDKILRVEQNDTRCSGTDPFLGGATRMACGSIRLHATGGCSHQVLDP